MKTTNHVRVAYVKCVSFINIICFPFSNAVSNNQPRKIGSIADIDPLNGVYGSMDYKTYGQQSHSQQTQQQTMSAQQPVRYTQQQTIQQNVQSAIQQKPIQKSISSQVVKKRNLFCLLRNNYNFALLINDWCLFFFFSFCNYSEFSEHYTITKHRIPMKLVLPKAI